jgi:molybdopterin-guanine dinucleotide biosynthesis protein
LGTTIYLKNVYKDRIIFPANFKELCTLLRNKYKLYLLENNIEIILHYLKDSIEEEVILEGFKDEAELIPEIKKEKFFQNLETHLVNLEVIEDLKERVIKLVNNDEELMFNYKTKIPELDNELFFTLGIQPQHRR